MEASNAFRPATRTQTSALSALEKKVLLWLAQSNPGLGKFGPFDHARFRLAAGRRFELLVFALLPDRAAAGSRFLRIELVRRQPGWNVGAGAQPPAAPLWILRGPYPRRLRQRFRFRRSSSFGIHERTYRGGFTGGVLSAERIEVYLATYTVGRFQLSFGAFSPTELRLLLIIGNVALWNKPFVTLAGKQYLLFDVGGLIGIAGLSTALLWSIVNHTTYLNRADTGSL
jgi:hypothetical protein